MKSENTKDLTPEELKEIRQSVENMTPEEKAQFRNSFDADEMGFYGEEGQTE